MVHTLPDYTSKWKNRTISSLVDNGELAARLGSIVTYDRRGNVVWMDDFEHSANKWSLLGAGTGNNLGISAAASRNGDSSMELTTGNDGARLAQMRQILGYPALSNHGLEFSFTYADELDYLRASFSIYDGALVHQFWINIDQTNQRVQYYDDGGNWVNTGITFEEIHFQPVFTPVKIVADVINNNYVRLIYGAETFDMAGIGTLAGIDASEPQIRILIAAHSNVAKNATVYIDDVIVTQNEV